MKGSYLLLIHLENDKNINIGKLGKINFRKGYYFYTGSAMGKSVNLENRIARHLRKNKRLRWHIDYLLEDRDAKIIDVFMFPDKNLECFLAKKLSINGEKINGFGCSDCKCETHLLYSKNYPSLDFLSSKELLTTDRELKAIAPPAIIGFNKKPVKG